MENFKVVLGLRLRTARKAANFKSAKEFAKKANVPATTYAQHESGKRAISVETLLHYCDILHLNPVWLLLGEEKPYIAKSTQDTLLMMASNTANQLFVPAEHRSTQFDDALKTEMALYNDIIKSALIATKGLDISVEEIIDFCMDVYRNIATISADERAKKKMIELSIASLARGYNKTHSTNKEKLIEKEH